MKGKKLVTRAIVLTTTTCNAACHLLLVKRTLREDEPKYHPTTVVLSTEVVKLLISLLMVLREKQWDAASVKKMLARSVENGKSLTLPALIYSVQNNFLFIGLSNLDAATFQVTNQLKIITTAIFMVLLLKKHFSLAQWFSLFILFIGVVLVQLDFELIPIRSESQAKNYWFGLAVVFITTITSGFAGVYFEMVIKKKSIAFWTCNVYLYLWGIVFSLLGLLCKDLQQIRRTGFFHGYSPYVITIIAMSSLGGLLSSLIIQQLNNIWKGFASSAAIVLAIYGSFVFFNAQLGLVFYVGAALVCLSTILFSIL